MQTFGQYLSFVAEYFGAIFGIEILRTFSPNAQKSPTEKHVLKFAYADESKTPWIENERLLINITLDYKISTYIK